MVTEVPFKVKEKDVGPEPLTTEHILFPLGLWLAGLLISAIFLVAEIIIQRRMKYQSKDSTVRH